MVCDSAICSTGSEPAVEARRKAKQAATRVSGLMCHQCCTATHPFSCHAQHVLMLDSRPFIQASSRLFQCAGESEAKVRQLFQEALRLAPCIIFIGALDQSLSWMMHSPVMQDDFCLFHTAIICTILETQLGELVCITPSPLTFVAISTYARYGLPVRCNLAEQRN